MLKDMLLMAGTLRISLFAALWIPLLMQSAFGEDYDETAAPLVVTADRYDQLTSAYGAPPDLSHGRISTLTKSYVLSPFCVELETSYSGSLYRHGTGDEHLFTQEIEVGLPGRLTAGLQNQVVHRAGDTAERSFAIEGRYALADWNKLPLNPAISASYKTGFDVKQPSAGELALLISHDFPHMIEWALNVYAEQEFGKGSSTNAGFAQSAEIPVLLPDEKLEVGVEMQYRSGGSDSGRSRVRKGVAIGPTLAWRPTKLIRFDVSPLFGCSDHTPAAEVFAVFSISLGTSDANDNDAPASARAEGR